MAVVVHFMTVADVVGAVAGGAPAICSPVLACASAPNTVDCRANATVSDLKTIGSRAMSIDKGVESIDCDVSTINTGVESMYSRVETIGKTANAIDNAVNATDKEANATGKIGYPGKR